MKLIKLLLLLVTFIPLRAQEPLFNYEYLNSDFNGLTFSQSEVIAYGNHGIILYSKDKGENWEQKKIADNNDNIIKIDYVNNNYFGICYNGSLIKSTDNGISWISKQATTNSKFLYFAINTQHIYVLTSSKKLEIYNFELDKINTIEIDSSVAPLGLYLFNDFLLIPNNKKSNFLTIDLNNEFSQSFIDINKYGNVITKFLVDEDKLYAQIKNSLYLANHENSDWTKVAQDVSVPNVKNGQLYNLKVTTNTSWKVGWLDYFKISEDMSQEKINIDSIDRYINPKIVEFQFIDENNIIAVGPNKTIYHSSDAGKKWILKSFFYNQFSTKIYNQIINKNLMYSANQGYIFKTTNSGVTWLPQKFTDTLIKRINYFSAFYIDSTGTGFAITDDDSNLSGDTTKNRNIIFTKDFGENYFGDYQQYLRNFTTRYGIQIIKTENNYLLQTALRLYPATYILKLDTNFKCIDRFLLDSIYICGTTVTTYNNGNLYSFANDGRNIYSQSVRDSSNLLQISSTDFGKSWQIEDSIKISGYFPSVEIFNGKDVFIRTQKMPPNGMGNSSDAFIYDTENKKINTIFSDTLSCGVFMYYDKKAFVYNHNSEIFSSENYRSNFPDWKKEYLTIDSIYFSGFTIKDNEYFATYYEKNKYNLIKLTPNSGTRVDDDINTSNYTFTTPANPIPAKDVVTFDFYWDNGHDITEAVIKVYNFLGNEISSINQISTIPKNSYSEQIIWDCSKVASGLYFINISFSNISKTIPIIVVR